MNTRPAVLSLLVCASLAAPAAAQLAPATPSRLATSPPSASAPATPLAPVAAPVTESADRVFAPRPETTDPGLQTLSRSAPGFGRLFSDLGNDLRRLPTRENALLLGIGAGLAGFASPHDGRVTSSMHGADEDAADFFGPGQYVGNFYLNLGASVATYAVGRATGSTTTAIVGADLVRAQILAQAATMGIKHIAGRTRPNGEARSFPSGHTSSAFATATVLQRHFGWKVGIPAYAVAGYVGASRLNANKHYLSDVAFGAALGIVAGRTVTVGIGSTKFALQPIAAQGGVGIGFTRIQKK